MPTDPRPRGRPPKGVRDNTPQDLLDAALRLFAKQGYAATTVRQIADQVGIRDSAIYAHFSAKQDLLDALIDQSEGQLIAKLQTRLDGAATLGPERALTDLVAELVAEWNRPRMRHMVSLFAREGFHDSIDVLGGLAATLRPHFLRWRKNGHVRADVSLSLLIWEFTAPLAAVRMLYLNAESPPARRKEGIRLAKAHVAFFLDSATL